jgi:anti-anti-sigma factor
MADIWGGDRRFAAATADAAATGRKSDSGVCTARSGTVLVVRGSLDEKGFPAFAAALTDLTASGGAALTVDLRQVGWVDAAALRCLVRTARHSRERGAALRVVCSPGPVARLVRLATVAVLPGAHLGAPAPRRVRERMAAGAA